MKAFENDENDKILSLKLFLFSRYLNFCLNCLVMQKKMILIQR